MFKKRLLTVLALFSFVIQSLCPAAVFAEDGAASLNLDLTSTAASVSASSLFASGGASSYTIDMAGASHTISSGDMVTPAQFLAVQQVASGSAQSILLSNQGAAIGGSFVLNSSLSQSVSSLLIPQGVTGIHDFSNSNILNITGNLVNSGTFYGVSSGGATTATISALNILNNQGGLLSTVLPAGGLAGFSNLFGGLNLSLIAVNDIVNAGSIYSAGALSATAGGSIINALPQGVTGMAPIMQAMSNLNLQAANIMNQGTLLAQAGNINATFSNLTNSGLMQSMLGNIAMQNLASNVLNINNNLGLISAADSISILNTQNLLGLDGSIVKPELDLNGGTLLANVINIDAGDGHLRVALQDMAGVLNVSAGTARFGVSDGTHPFVLGSFVTTGDPDLDLTVASYDDGGAGFDTQGGYIDITTTVGGIVFTGLIDSTTDVIGGGPGGSVTLNSATSISTANIVTSGLTNGNAGAINFTAVTGITTGEIFAQGGDTSGDGGAVTMQTTNGDIVIGGQMQLSGAGAGVGNGGVVSLTADNGNISTNLINSLGGVGNGVLGGNGGGVTLSALTGTITMSQFLDSSARFNGSAGAVLIEADGDIALVSVRANGPDSGAGNGNTINLTSTSGQLISVFTASLDGNFFASSADSPNSPIGSNGNGAAITINTATGIAQGVGATLFSFRAEGGRLNGDGANITINTQGFANLEFISSSGGNIGNAGTVNITADAGMNVVSVRSEGGYNGGNGNTINLTSTDGGATITAGTGGGLFLSTAAYVNGTGASITVLADSDVNIGDVYTWGRDDQNAGLVSITSSNTNVTTRFIDTTALTGTTGVGGTVNISGQTITTDYIDSSGAGGGGNVTLMGDTGTVTTTSIITSSLAAGDAGDILINTDGAINTTFLSTLSNGTGAGGDITFTSNTSTITTTTIDAQSSGTGSGGAITFEASTGISTGTILTMGGVSILGNGGLVYLNTPSGDITTGDITTLTRIDGGTSGAITVSTGNGNLILGTVDSTGGTGTTSGNAGTIDLTATGGGLTATGILARANVPALYGANGNGAAVTIEADGNVTVTDTAIQTQACGNGTGGAVSITAAGDLFIDTTFSGTAFGITTWGGLDSAGGGSITVDMGGNISVGQVNASAGGVTAGGPAGPLTGTGNGGNVDLRSNGTMTLLNAVATFGGTDGGDGGTILLNADTSITGQTIGSRGGAVGNAGTVSITSLGAVIVGDVTALGGSTSGNGANIDITGGTVNAGNVNASALSDGNAGQIFVLADNGITTLALTSGAGAVSGNGALTRVETVAGSISLASVDTRARGSGFTSGNIILDGPDGITVTNGIDATGGNSLLVGGTSGNAGSVNITSNGDVSATFISAAANVTNTAGPNGNGNNVDINIGGTLTVTETGISTIACGNGTAGNIAIIAGGDVTILDPFAITDFGLSAWGGIGSGGGGNITVNAGGAVFVPQVASNAVGVVNGGPTGPLTGVGNGGFINITAGTGIFIVNDCASSGGADGGNSGTITLTSTTGDITVIGTLAATANNALGNGADITLNAVAGAITVNNITRTNAAGVGNAGAITMDAVTGITLVNVEASGGLTSGDGGNINITTTGGNIVANSYMNSRARGLGDAGDITLTAAAGAVAVLDADPLTGSALDASGDGAGGDGGDITINFDQSGAGTFIIDPNGVGITNGVRGNISTSADNNGNAGFLTINDAGGATNNITIELRGTINLDSLSGLDNSFSTSEAGGSIVINGDANGQLLGTLVANADSVTVNLARVGTTLNTGNVTSVNGAVSLTLTGAGANLNMAAGSTISSNASNNVTLQASNINMGAGSAVNAGTSAIVTSNNIVVGNGSTGAITANGGGTITISALVGQNLTFNKTAGAGTGTLNLTGGAVTINVTNGVLTNSASTLVSSNNNILVNLNGSSLVNNGTMTSVAPGGQLNLASTSGNLTVSGATGILTAPTVTANNTAGSISLSQATVTGSLSGSANGNFVATTTGVGGLTVNNTVNAGNGFVTLTTTGGAMNVLAGGTVTATTNVTISGGTGVNIGAAAGAAVLIRGGVLAGGLDQNSISMADYDLSGITTPGAISVTSVAGNVVFGDSVTMRAFGSTLGVVSANNINIGTGADFIVQGGNLWLDAANIVNGTTGVSLTSVARYTAGTVVIDNTNIQNFVGGGVAVWAGNPGTNLNAMLNNMALARVAAGTNVVSPGVNLAGSTTTYTNGYNVQMIAGGAGKIGATNSSFVANGGVISMDPPGDQLDFSNSAITAIGPQLIAVPVGGGGGSTGGAGTGFTSDAAAAAAAGAVAAAGAGAPATRVPTDVTGPIVTGQENTDIEFSNNTAITLSKATSQANDSQSSRFIVSMNSCQPFCFADDNEAAFLGKGGTKFALAGDRTIALKEGKIFAMAGRRDLTIKTEYGNAIVPAESAGLIEQNANGAMRLIALSGKPSSFSIEKAGKTTVISAAPGEEVVVGDESLGEEEMIPVDGVDRQKVIDGSIQVAGYQVAKSSFNKKQLIEREMLITCNMGSSFFMRRKDKLLHDNYISAQPVAPRKTSQSLDPKTSQSTTTKISQSSAVKTSQGTTSKKSSLSLKPQSAPAASKQSNLKPVAFNSASPLVSQSSGLFTIETESSKIKHSPESQVHLDASGAIVLKSGEALICADKPTKVKAGNYEVFVDKGGIVLVKQSARHFTVANLYEPKSNCLKVTFNNQYASAPVGNELVFAEDGTFTSAILRADKVGRRRVRAFDLGDSLELTKSEISVASLMQNRDVLSRLLKSEHPLDKDIAQRLLKMAACIAVTSVSHGPYSSAGQK